MVCDTEEEIYALLVRQSQLTYKRKLGGGLNTEELEEDKRLYFLAKELTGESFKKAYARFLARPKQRGEY